jgi:hypothetical protein
VIGSTPSPASAYPAGPAWSADPGSQCVEPPLSDPNVDAGSLPTNKFKRRV